MAASTVHNSELEKYNLYSFEQWWNPGNLLLKMNAIRVPFVRDGILEFEGIISKETENCQQPLKGVKILDAGCGGGILSEGLARLGADVVGVDIAPNLIRVATEHAKVDETLTNKPTYINTTLEEHSQSFPNFYDAVVSSEVVEHVNNRQEFVRILARLVKPSGSLFVTTINRNFKSLAVAIILMEHVTKSIPLGTHNYNMLVKPEELKEELNNCGCTVKHIRGMHYSSAKGRWEFCTDTQVWYLLHAVKE